MADVDLTKLPKHIAIIMDGNGRWAKNRGLPRILGHQEGAASVTRVVEFCRALGVQALTLYAFSWENWSRPALEVKLLMTLLGDYLQHELPRLKKRQICLKAIGRLEHIANKPRRQLEEVMAVTKEHKAMTLTLALSYGGRQELVDAIRKLAVQVKEGTLQPEAIDEALIAQNLYAPDLPDPDLIIRTSGEMRLSNFMLWQSSYAELYVTPTPWPEFSKEDLEMAICAYQSRERRFGKTGVAA